MGAAVHQGRSMQSSMQRLLSKVASKHLAQDERQHSVMSRHVARKTSVMPLKLDEKLRASLHPNSSLLGTSKRCSRISKKRLINPKSCFKSPLKAPCQKYVPQTRRWMTGINSTVRTRCGKLLPWPGLWDILPSRPNVANTKHRHGG